MITVLVGCFVCVYVGFELGLVYFGLVCVYRLDGCCGCCCLFYCCYLFVSVASW